MNFLSAPVLVGLLCNLSRFTVPFNQGIQPSRQFCRSLAISATGIDNFDNNPDSSLLEHLRELEREKLMLQCENSELQSEIRKLKETNFDVERVVSMVYESHRRFRHLVAELDLNCGTLSQSKAEQHYQHVQRGKIHGRNKEIYRILKTESSSDYRFLKDFRNNYAHHSTLDLNHLHEWQSQLSRFLDRNLVDSVETKLAQEALRILKDVIGFLSDPKNRKSIQYRRSFDQKSELASSNSKACEFGLDQEISKKSLKKLIKKNYKNSSCCGNMDSCIQKAFFKLKDTGYIFAPKLERKLSAEVTDSVPFNSKNPFRDSNFSSKKVSKSFTSESKSVEEQDYDNGYDDEEDEEEEDDESSESFDLENLPISS